MKCMKRYGRRQQLSVSIYIYIYIYIFIYLFIFIFIYLFMEAGQLSRYSNSLRAGRSGDRMTVWEKVSAQVQNSSKAHAMGTGFFPTGKAAGGRGDVDHPSHLAPKLKKEQSYTSIPHLGLRGLYAQYATGEPEEIYDKPQSEQPAVSSKPEQGVSQMPVEMRQLC